MKRNADKLLECRSSINEKIPAINAAVAATAATTKPSNIS